MIGMKAPDFWKAHYVTASDPEEVAATLRHDYFVSAGRQLELLHFPGGGESAILISQGSGGHPYVFAEFAFALHRLGHEVFVMPKHGAGSVPDLMGRHRDALIQVRERCGFPVTLYGEGVGGYVAFYLALAHAPMARLICQNSPAIMTESEYRRALLSDAGPWRHAVMRRRLMLPAAPALARLMPGVRIPVWSYLPWRDLVDFRDGPHQVEHRLVVDGYLRDPDFDRWYPLRAVASLVTTPPPGRIVDLETPTMFVVATEGPTPGYIRDLHARLPGSGHRLVGVEGSVYWMLSHPFEAAELVHGWARGAE